MITKFQSIYDYKREENAVVDWLACTNCTMNNNLSILDLPPFYVRKLLLEDKFGLSSVRS